MRRSTKLKINLLLVSFLLVATLATANEKLAGKTIEFKDYTGDYGHEYEANTLEFSEDLTSMKITLKVNNLKNFDIPEVVREFTIPIRVVGDIVYSSEVYLCEIIAIKDDIAILSFPDPLGEIKIFKIID